MVNELSKVAYEVIPASDLDKIAILWEQLKEHHKGRSVHFKERFEHMTFEERKSKLLAKAEEERIYVETAKEQQTMKTVGYCISTITNNGIGEIDSLFVLEEFRGSGIADTFMQHALDWMDEQAVQVKQIVVSCGNEEVFGFYARYGFYPCLTTLFQKREK